MTRKGLNPEASKDAAEDTGCGSIQQQIASLAYALWQERGCPEGSPDQDWLNAEQQVQQGRSEGLTLVHSAPRAETAD